MQEDLLQTIWKHLLFSTRELKTVSGEVVRIIKQGEQNTNAGPDFLNAQVQIGKVRWAGSVEIHTKTSLWNVHGHSTDKAYENVILHVVYEDDLQEKSKIPLLELKNYIADSVLDKYSVLHSNNYYIPCEKQISGVDPFIRSTWMERMLIEKLEQRVHGIEEKIKSTKGDWREVFYQYLGRNYGFKVNSEAFEKLAETLPQSILAKHRNNLAQMEALLYGKAGMLYNDFTDTYPGALKKEWNFLKLKYGLTPIESGRWKFLRMRPDNFPTIRISQFARLAYNSENLFSVILETDSIKELQSHFKSEASRYWNTHYTFDNPAQEDIPKKMGRSSIDILLINTVAPMMYAYGYLRKEQKFIDKALEILQQIKPEKNSITLNMSGIGFVNKSAFDSQSILHLKKNYCDKKLCLSCGIGVNVLGR